MSNNSDEKHHPHRLKHEIATLTQELKEQRAKGEFLQQQINALQLKQEKDKNYLAEWERRVITAEAQLKEQQNLFKGLQGRLTAETGRKESFHSQLLMAQAGLQDTTRKLQICEEVRSKAESRVEHLETELGDLQRQYHDAHQQIIRLRIEKDRAQSRSTVRGEKLSGAIEKVLSDETEHQALTLQLRKYQEELEDARKQAIDSKSRLFSTEEELAEVKRQLNSAEVKAQEFEQQSLSDRSQLHTHLTQFQETSTNLAAAKAEIARLTELSQRFETQLIDLREKHLEEQKQLQETQRRLKDTHGDFEESKERIEALEKELEQARLESEDARAKLPRYERAYGEIEEKNKTLQELTERLKHQETQIETLQKEKIALSQQLTQIKPMPQAIRLFVEETEHGQILLELAEGKRSFQDLSRKFNYSPVMLMRELRHLRDKHFVLIDEEKREATLVP
ncbi:MAG: hypothetical protein ACFFBD_18960 [Candidatus Hodarchaeota archaeon]